MGDGYFCTWGIFFGGVVRAIWCVVISEGRPDWRYPVTVRRQTQSDCPFPEDRRVVAPCKVTHGLVKSVVGTGCALLPLSLPVDIMFAILLRSGNLVRVGELVPWVFAV